MTIAMFAGLMFVLGAILGITFASFIMIYRGMEKIEGKMDNIIALLTRIAPEGK